MTHAAAHVFQNEGRILFGLEPYPDESFFGFTARLASHNHFETRQSFLVRLGFPNFRMQGLEGAIETPDKIAWQLRLTEKQLNKLTARSDQEGVEYRKFIDLIRRVSPAGLCYSPYHRMRWALKIPYCAKSWEILVQDCPACNRPLGWQRTLRVELCEHCGFDLRGARTSVVPSRQRKWLALLAALIDPEPSHRDTAKLALPPQVMDSSPALIFEVAMVFARVTAHMRSTRTFTPSGAVEGGAQRAADMAEGMEILARYPESFDERMTSGNVTLPIFFRLVNARAGSRCAKVVKALYRDWEPCPHGPSRLRAQRESLGQMTLREAARELRIENRALRVLIDKGLIRAPAGRGVVRKIQWLDPESVREVGRQLRSRMSLHEFSRSFKIPPSGITQLISLGLLDINENPVVEALQSEIQLDRDVARCFASRVLALRHVPPLDVALLPLEDLFHGVGAQHKPWGAIIKAALEKKIVLYSDDRLSQTLSIGKLQIRRSFAWQILAREHPGLLLIPKLVELDLYELFMTRTEAEDYLNCFPRDLSWLVEKRHLRSDPYCSDKVVELGRKLISSREISWRWRVSPSFREAMAKNRGIKRTLGPFWSRDAVEGYFAEVFPAGRPI